MGLDWYGGAGGRAGSLDRMADPDGTAAEASGSPAPDPASDDAGTTPRRPRSSCATSASSGSPSSTRCVTEGTDPYPVRFDADTTAGALRAEYGDLEPGTTTGTEVRLAGRILLLRRQGKLSFATVQDRDGSIQLFVNQREIGEDAHDAFDRLDRGDWIGVTGTVMTTKRGELSIGVQDFQLLSKALRPLPEKWHGLSDVDTRYRQRYVDLVVNEDARRIALARIDIIAALRAHLVASGLPRGRGPGAPDDPGRRDGASRSPPTTTRSARTCTCGSRWSCTSSASSSAASTASSRSAACSATRASTPRTTPSSRCSRRTARSATTRR